MVVTSLASLPLPKCVGLSLPSLMKCFGIVVRATDLSSAVRCLLNEAQLCREEESCARFVDLLNLRQQEADGRDNLTTPSPQGYPCP